jgi:hypothetical protein
MRVVLTEMLRRRTLDAASARAERVTRRNVTFSPVDGTRVTAPRRARAGGSPRHAVTARSELGPHRDEDPDLAARTSV